MMAQDEVLVSSVEAVEIAQLRNPGELSAFSAVAVPASQHEIPYPVEVDIPHFPAQHMREEMVNVTKIWVELVFRDRIFRSHTTVVIIKRDVRVIHARRLVAQNERALLPVCRGRGDSGETVEAAALLVAVQRVAYGGDVLPAQATVYDDALASLVIREQVRIDSHLSSGLDQIPPGFGLMKKISHLIGSGERKHVVGQDDALCAAREIFSKNLIGTSF